MPVSHVGNSLDPESRRALIARVAASPRFQKAPRLRQLLTYIGDRSLDDEREPPREIEIGLQVFGRQPEFDPSGDNIVRNAARQLRTKLREYFEEEGTAEAWTVDIPKGGYRAVFAPRPVVSVPAPLPPVRSARLIWVGAAILLFSLAAHAYLWLSKPDSAPVQNHLVGALFSSTSSPVWIVVGDFGSYLTSHLQGRQAFTLNEYVDRQYLRFQLPAPADPVVQRFADTLSTRQVVSMGEMNAAIAYHLELSRGRPKAVVRHARTLAMRDLRRGNLIILGTSSSNPWFHLFEDRSRFRMIPSGFADSENTRQYSISVPKASGGRAYVRISATKSLDGTGSVLTICGVNMGAVEAGAEFTLNPAAFGSLQTALGANGALPQFEALLETAVTDFTPNSYRIVTTHRHGQF